MRYRRIALLAAIAEAVFAVNASAADLSVKGPPPAMVAPAANWNGWYVGLNAGYGWGTSFTDLTAVDPFFIARQTPARPILPTSLTPRPAGFVGGAQAGYNWQIDRTVVGLETDIAFSDMKKDASYTFLDVNEFVTTTQSNRITWLGTVRPRLGWLPSPSTLLYATGGLAYGGVKASTNVSIPGVCPLLNAFCSSGSASQTRVGWTAGGGVEQALGSNWTGKIEYLYFDLGSTSYSIFDSFGTEVMRADAKFNGHIVRFGLNYKVN